ncbi:MAG: hypothetical protein HUU21_01790 [Polyangiaceae bacterium]|nr:hypothetical protein [Polyangiaceae bacterium]NUQ72266.1 hypothetical protein [Polyangiaceae bacterium]
MPRYLSLKCATAFSFAAAVLALTGSASAENSPRLMITARGGAGTEGSGGLSLEVRPLGDLILGGAFDGGVNFSGTYGSYSFWAPAAYGGYSFYSNDFFDVRALAGARFPFGISVSEDSKQDIVNSGTAAFMASVRVSFMIGMWVIGLQGDMSPHSVTWDYKCPTMCDPMRTDQAFAGKPEDTTEWMFRGALVFGIALGKAGGEPEGGGGGGGEGPPPPPEE